MKKTKPVKRSSRFQLEVLQQAQHFYQQGRYQEIVAQMEEAAPQQAKSSELLNLAGISAIFLGQPDKSEAFLRRAIDLQPNFADAHNNLGNLYMELQRPVEAEDCYRRTLVLQPNSASVHSNLGELLRRQNRFVEAETFFRESLRIQANHSAYQNLGHLYSDLKRFVDAEACYRRALALKPDYLEALWSLSQLELSLGHFAEGLRDHEVRYHPALQSRLTAAPTHLPFPQWEGQPLQGKSILVWAEQGYGDQIQFCRYCSELKRLGARRVTLLCQSPLKTLFNSLAAVDELLVMEEAADLKSHDYWVLLMSLPLHCGTTLASIPAVLPYLYPLPGKVSRWSRRLPKYGLRVGLVWKGAAAHKNDAKRSLPGLHSLAALWTIPGVLFISLQKGQGESEAALPPPNQPLLDLGAEIRDFADLAAVVAELDLVICVDTAVAHLAGALQKPCWVLLPGQGTDWRWLQELSNSPWYPGVMRLFRQQPADDWSQVVKEVAMALGAWCRKQKISGTVIGTQRQKRLGLVGRVQSWLGLKPDAGDNV
jgi:tetratricopeptide (TPR) repeat protein